MEQNEIKRDNRKALPKYLLILLVSGVIGGVLGFTSGWMGHDSLSETVIAAVNGEKISFQCVCGKDAVAKGLKAGDIIKNITAIAGGKGGGKPDSAMGGGNDLSKLDEALAAVERFVREKI